MSDEVQEFTYAQAFQRLLDGKHIGGWIGPDKVKVRICSGNLQFMLNNRSNWTYAMIQDFNGYFFSWPPEPAGLMDAFPHLLNGAQARPADLWNTEEWIFFVANGQLRFRSSGGAVDNFILIDAYFNNRSWVVRHTKNEDWFSATEPVPVR